MHTVALGIVPAAAHTTAAHTTAAHTTGGGHAGEAHDIGRMLWGAAGIMVTMATTRAELSSISTLLSDLTDRVTSLAERARDQKDAELSGELFTVERDLRAALRRLGRAALQGGAARHGARQ